MKKILGVLLLLTAAAFAQTTYNVNATTGTLTGGIAGRVKLTGASTVVAVIINGGPPEFEGGSVSFQTGTITSGHVQVGATFGAGGSFIVTTANEGTIFTGTFNDATWTPAFNANGTHSYVLTGTLTDPAGDTGAFSLLTTTDTSITCFFSGKETIQTVNISLTINSPH